MSSSSSIEESVRSIVNDPRQLEVRSEIISKELLSNQLDISSLIESLGFALTSTEVELRQCSTNLLSTVLAQLPPDTLSDAQLQFIVTFYCDRLKDHHSVAPAVFTGLLAIVQMDAFPAVGASRVLQAMFQHISCQSQVREDRQKIFNILKVLCSTQVPELLSMGTDLVYGVVNAIDGERDPRILLYIFEFVPHFVRTYPLGHLTEEMFEVCACYFPVDFHPSPDDPASITRDRLAAALAQCLAGHADFAEFCVPLLLEKLDSQLVVAKLDSLQLLRFGADAFSAADIEKEFPAIWSALHMEVISNGTSSTDIAAVALDALQAIVRAASAEDSSTCAQNVLIVIFERIMGSLCNVLSNLFDASMQIAVACSRASKFAATFTCGKVLPLLLSEVDSYKENPSKTAAIYEHMTQTIEACIEFECVDAIDVDSLAAFHDKLIAGLAGDTDTRTLQRACLHCLSKLVRALTASNRTAIYVHVNCLLADGSSTVVQQVNALLLSLAENYADEVKESILNQWLVADELPSSSAKHIIATIAGLVRIAAFTKTSIEFLFRHIFERIDSSVGDVALDSLEQVMLHMSGELFDYLYHKCAIADKLVQFVRAENAPHSAETLCKISGCIRTVVKRLDVDEQSRLIRRHLPGVNFTRTADVYLAVGLCAYASESVDVGTEVFGKLLAELTQICLSGEGADASVVEICLHTLCSLVNKAHATTESDAIVASVVERLQLDVAGNDANALRILAWLAKGLLLRGQSKGFDMVQLLFDLADDNARFGDQVLQAFDVITADRPSLHLPVTRFLHRQKLLQFVLVRTVAVQSDARIRAFAFVLRATPVAVLNINLGQIMPLMFKGLSLSDPLAVQIFITVIDELIGARNELILGHLNRLIPLYLQLCSFKGSMKIRVAALQGMHSITKYPTVALTPYKQDVLFALAAPLDDPKRLVRNAAVIARNQWFLV